MGRLSYVAAVAAVALSATPASAQGLIRDAEIESMVREFSEPLFVAAGLNPDAVGTHLIADSSLNAFVTNGQNMFLHTGIITASETPNELISVIAHETGHMSGGHLVRQREGVRQAMAPMLATIAAGILAAAAGEGGAAAALIASSQQFALLNFFQFTQAIESQADQAAIDFLEETGQSGEGLIIFFDRFRVQEILTESRDPYFRTHPLSSDRVAALRESVDAQQHAAMADTAEHIELLDRAQAKIIGFIEPMRVVLRHYPMDDTSTPAIYARSIAQYRIGSLAESLESINELIEREPDNPYFHELKGQIYYESGRAAEAVEPYRRSVELAPDSALLRVGLAQALIDHGDDAFLPEAMENLVFAQAAEPSNSFAWYQRSRVHERRGERALAQLAIAEQNFAIGNAPRAAQFAHRAQQDLEQGTPEWLRASDIVATGQVVMEEQAANGRR